MRFTFLFLCLLWAACPIKGQSQFTFEPQANADDETAYIHILYRPEGGGIVGYRLRTTFAPDDPVRLFPNSYTLLEVSEDYLGFFANSSERIRPLVLDLERGKHYFYRFTRIEQVGLGFGVKIDEMAEQEFKMELFFNNIDPEPKRTYELGMPGS
jgi:hypothetical protein